MTDTASIERPAEVFDPEQSMRAKKAAELLDIGLSTWWAWVKVGKAPQPFYVNDQPRWRRADVLALRASRQGSA